MIKTFITAGLLMMAGLSAAQAGSRVDDQHKFLLTDCALPEGEVAPSHGGPIYPRVSPPADAAPWLENRAWDQRSMTECEPAPVKRPVHKPAHKPKGVPQK